MCVVELEDQLGFTKTGKGSSDSVCTRYLENMSYCTWCTCCTPCILEPWWSSVVIDWIL